MRLIKNPQPFILLCAMLACVAGCSGPMPEISKPGPQPGDIYKEYRAVTGGWPDWAIIDPNATHHNAGQYLPNAISKITVDDLAVALKAEVLVDRWGGHVGTTRKQIRFNGNSWIDLPELLTTPPGHNPECYMSEDNPVVQVPLSHLKPGENTFEGLCGGQICHSFGWGEWGLYGIILRIYFPKSKPYPTGKIVSPRTGETVQENVIIKVEANAAAGISTVDVLACYEGYDVDGDGRYYDWHGFYHRTNATLPHIPLSEHVGSDSTAPYDIVWNTEWVPDQEKRAVKFLARIQDNNGVWYVTQPVENITLERTGHRVKLYKAQNVPESFQVRMKRTMSCDFAIPGSDDLSKAERARIHFRTWNGFDGNPEIDGNEWFAFNGWQGKIAGIDHNYAHTVRELPVELLKSGTNTLSVYSEAGTVYGKDGTHYNTHSMEILWPGPGLVVRFRE